MSTARSAAFTLFPYSAEPVLSQTAILIGTPTKTTVCPADDEDDAVAVVATAPVAVAVAAAVAGGEKPIFFYPF